MVHLLTKSEYMLFLKHPAWLWLKVHDKSQLPPVDAGTQAIFDAGHAFEPYAELLFPGGIRLGFSDYRSYLELPARTREALKDSPTIYQGRFESSTCTFICDVMTVVGERLVDLTEIKSSTRVKDDHLVDLAFQTAVLTEAGYQVGKVCVAHVNNEYVRKGGIVPQELVRVVDVTEQVFALKENTRASIKRALSVLNSPTCPPLSPALCGPGALGEWLPIYRLLANVGEGSIYDLCLLTVEQIAELEAQNITRLADIPDDFALSSRQQRQVEAVKKGQALVEPGPLRAILDEYRYPLYFLDYETFSSAVPDFDGLRPYEQIPFQYSLHVVDKSGAPARHLGYLHSESSNPALSLSKSLRHDLGNKGSIVTWNASFEKGCNERLARLLPQYAEFYHDLNDRIVDLIIPFSSGLYVHPGFLGKSSIKNVLPVLVPELSYKELAIGEGNSAQRLWMDAVLYQKDGLDKTKILADLVEYCQLDTLAMVRIYEHLLCCLPVKLNNTT